MYNKVQEYYGRTLRHSDDLQNRACCDQALAFDLQTTEASDSSGGCC